MPAQAKATIDQVLAAAADLRASGERVTGCSLRRVLGHGRPDRLMAIIEEHDASTAPAPPVAPTLPPVMADLVSTLEQRMAAEVRSLADEAWQKASEVASHRMEIDLAEMRSSLADMRQNCADLNEALALADIEQEQRLREIADLQDKVRSSREELLAIRGTLAEVRNREREARDEALAARRETDRVCAIANQVREACASVVALPAFVTEAFATIKAAPGSIVQAERSLETTGGQPQLHPKRKTMRADREVSPDGASTTLYRMSP